MRATTWQGQRSVAVQEVPDPAIVNPGDLLLRVTQTALCAADLRLYDGTLPGMRRGDVMGHEPVGEVVETGPSVTRFRPGDRVVVSPVVACGRCDYCRAERFALCDNSNPYARLQERALLYPAAGLFGDARPSGGYPGAQAQYVRVPFADTGACAIPDGVSDAQAACVADAFASGWAAAARCGIAGGETVAVWGAGAVGLLAMTAAWLQGAARVLAVDAAPWRLALARARCGAEPVDARQVTVPEFVREMTGGRGPDCCIDTTGGAGDGAALAQAVLACRKGGTVAVTGPWPVTADRLPLGIAHAKGLVLALGAAHAPAHLERLLALVAEGRADPSFVLTHRFGLDEAPRAYALAHARGDGCVKVALAVA